MDIVIEQVQTDILQRIEKNDPGIIYSGDHLQAVWDGLSIPLENMTREPFWNLYTEGSQDKISLAPMRSINMIPSYPLDDCVEGDWSYGTAVKYAITMPASSRT